VDEPILSSAYVRIWLATFAIFLNFGIVLLAVPLYARDMLDARDFAIGVAVGAASVSAVLLGPPSGRVGDWYGRRVVLVGGSALVLACSLALLFEPSLAALTVIRFVAGAGEAAFVVAAYTVVADLAPVSRRGEAMSVATVASYGGLALGPILSDLLVGDDRFRLAWAVAAVCAAVATVLALSLGETRPAIEEDADRRLLPPRPALAPALVLLLALMGFGGFVAFAGLYARELGVRPGLLFALFGGIVLLVRAFGRTIPDRLGPRTAASGACTAIAAGLLVMAVWQQPAGVIAGAAVFAVGQSLAYPAITLLAITRTAPAERSAAIGAVGAAVDSALGLGALALGTASEVVGYAGAFGVAAGVAALGLAVLARIGPAPAS
jgi:MFS family permease